jgi:hypothetical protein
MEVEMLQDEDSRRGARQKFLEALSSGMSGPSCAPMPGTLLEMLEIAAIERRQGHDTLFASEPLETSHLTSAQNNSRMTGRLLQVGKTVVDVGGWLRALFGHRRVPV